MNIFSKKCSFGLRSLYKSSRAWVFAVFTDTCILLPKLNIMWIPDPILISYYTCHLLTWSETLFLIYLNMDITLRHGCKEETIEISSKKLLYPLAGKQIGKIHKLSFSNIRRFPYETIIWTQNGSISWMDMINKRGSLPCTLGGTYFTTPIGSL